VRQAITINYTKYTSPRVYSIVNLTPQYVLKHRF